MTPRETESDNGRNGLAAIWVPGLLVAVGAAVATAHGLYEVARAAGAPTLIAGLYPLITDGLALVAYAATARLTDTARRYAWTVVVLAAGLSGLAQASHLADGVATAPAALRFGVGAWPAIAAAIVAHLLFLLATHAPEAVQRPEPVRASSRTPNDRLSSPPDARTRPYRSHRPTRPRRWTPPTRRTDPLRRHRARLRGRPGATRRPRAPRPPRLPAHRPSPRRPRRRVARHRRRGPQGPPRTARTTPRRAPRRRSEEQPMSTHSENLKTSRQTSTHPARPLTTRTTSKSRPQNHKIKSRSHPCITIPR